jgi:hypothetical protein
MSGETPRIDVNGQQLTERQEAFLKGYEAAEDGGDLSRDTNGDQYRGAFLAGAEAALKDDFGTEVVLSDN